MALRARLQFPSISSTRPRAAPGLTISTPHGSAVHSTSREIRSGCRAAYDTHRGAVYYSPQVEPLQSKVRNDGSDVGHLGFQGEVIDLSPGRADPPPIKAYEQTAPA